MAGPRPPAGAHPVTTLRTVIVDDDAASRQGLRMLLLAEEGIEVVGEGGNGREAIEAVHRLDPDVLVMDMVMPEMTGMEATRLLIEQGVTTKVLIVTVLESVDTVYEALRSGASGFLLKDSARSLLALAVRIVAAGDALVDPKLTHRVITSASASWTASNDASRRHASLSAREAEVLTHVTKGLSNQEIAITLGLSESTVKTHVSSMLSKLDVRDRVQAVIVAFENRWVTLSP